MAGMRLTGHVETSGAMLTSAVGEYFKCMFSYALDDKYSIESLDTVKHPRRQRLFTEDEKLALMKALCVFIQEAIGMTYTEVDKKYGRIRDNSDFASDIEEGRDFPVIHYQLAEKGLGKIARIHGYVRNGVFVVKRLDWNHRYHARRQS